jgi:hypothetical protein
LLIGNSHAHIYIHHAGYLFANELATDAQGVSNGGLVREVQCARDKAALMAGLLRNYGSENGALRKGSSSSSGAAGTLVYLGDSVSDLKALLTVRLQSKEVSSNGLESTWCLIIYLKALLTVGVQGIGVLSNGLE